MPRFRTVMVLFSLFFAVTAAVSLFFYHQLTRPVLMQASIVEIKPGDQKKQFADKLAGLGLTSYPRLFAAFMYTHHQTIKRGEYVFQPGSSLYTIWLQVSRGTGFYQRAFTIVPGWTIKQLRQALLSTDALRHDAAGQTDAVWSQMLKLSTPPEGLLLPETYFYTKGSSDWMILQKALHLMQVKLAVLWVNRALDLPFQSAYEALIAASLIEKEAYHDDERPMIAGVLINRLKKHMLLQFDPSVIYGLGDRYDGRIHKQDLLEKTPYNTYVIRGLPPTPIAFPSVKSIESVLHPAQHEYLYFVVETEKRHRFSTTLKQHHDAVTVYRKEEKKV